MFQPFIARYVRIQFARLGEGDSEAVLRGVADNVHQRFAGDHPLGGERHDKQSLRLWFERLFRLCQSSRSMSEASACLAGPGT
jgi:ketosteroid isomerase-like protein